jgi:3-isopropylmalate dehydrogenase
MTKCKKKIVLLPGDGIGPEVILSAARLLEDCAGEFGHQFDLIETLVGGVAIDRCGSALPAETVRACREAWAGPAGTRRHSAAGLKAVCSP